MFSVRRAIHYLGIAVLLLFGFYLLHYLGNQLPQQRAFEVVREAFETHNLKPKAVMPEHSKSIRSLIGINLFADCEMLNSMIAAPSGRIEDAIVPKRLFAKRGHERGGPCGELHRIVMQEQKHYTWHMKSRYRHGAKALIAIALRWQALDLFQINAGIKALTYFAYLLLALVALAHSTRLLLILSPLIFLGFFFSGIPYYGGFARSLPYLFALAALIALVLLLRAQARPHTVRLFFFATGMVSAYLFLLSGHLLLLLPAAVVILYFGRTGVPELRRRLIDVACCMGSFAAGFVCSYGADQLAKAYYLGMHMLYRAGDQLAWRMSDGRSDGVLHTLNVLFQHAYQTVGLMGNETLYALIVFASSAALITAVIVGTLRAYGAKSIAAAAGVIVILAAIAMVLVRLGLFPQHSMQHNLLIGRYMFVPIALAWSALIVALCETDRYRLRIRGG